MMQVLIRAMRLEAHNVVSLELVREDGAALPAFEAGAHVDVHLPSGLIRQYSLCNHPNEHHRYRIAVLNDSASRGGSRAVHEELRVGQLISISAPRNLFALDTSARRSLLFAGGIGITPILSMAHRLAHQGQDFELHYCAKAYEKAAFAQELKALPFAERVHFHFGTGAQSRPLDTQALFAGESRDSHVYVCGPSGFMESVLGAARANGWPESHLHREHFTAAPTAKPDDGSFEVQVHSSGQTVLVAPDQTVIQALENAGVYVPVSCEQGICGTCVTRVLEGEPDHRDQYLSEAEHALNDQFTPCCSRALSGRLVLDL